MNSDLTIGCLGLIVAVIIAIVLGMFADKAATDSVKKDGFVIVEEHSTYDVVTKSGHTYIHTWSRYGGHKYEHSPECPCNNKKSK